jgi:hypothetical protein
MQIGTNNSSLTYNVTGTSTIFCVVTYGGTGINCPDNVPATSNTIAFNPVPAPTQPALPSGLSTVCANQTGVTYTTSAANATSFSWTVTGGNIVSGQGTNTVIINWGGTPGTYTITITAYNQCGVASPVSIISITVLPTLTPPSVTISDAAGGPTLICVNDCINFSATLNDPSNIVKTIVWKIDGTPMFTATSTTTASFVYPNSGSFNYCFTVSGTHAVNCEITFAGQPSPGQCYSPNIVVSNTIVYTVNNCTGIAEAVPQSSLKIFPNPSDGAVNIEWEYVSGNMNEIIIADLAGKIISEFRTEENFLRLESSLIRSGTYFVTVKAGEKIFRSRAVIY